MEKMNKGDASRITRDYFDSLLLELRLLDAGLPDTRLCLYGEEFATPVMTAALSHLNGTRPNGMVEMAKGAKAANAVTWAGMGDEAELDAMIATGARVIKIVKPYADEDLIRRKLTHAEKAGAFAVGMDIDHAFNRKGGYDEVHGNPMRPKTTEQIASYVKVTKLPFIVKGVLSELDAVKCLEAGVSGVVISHHHGILNYAVPPLMILPRIVKAVKGRMSIFVDCGLESGYDVFKALALGADAVSLGRVIMPPLGENGADGVRDTINAITDELASIMAKTGSGNIKGIDPSVIVSCGQ